MALSGVGLPSILLAIEGLEGDYGMNVLWIAEVAFKNVYRDLHRVIRR